MKKTNPFWRLLIRLKHKHIMKTYKIAFVGLGSIGKRHLKNLTDILLKRGDAFFVDAYRSSVANELPQDIKALLSHEFLSSEPLPQNTMYDMVFVTNPTSMHWDTIQKFKGHTKSFFIEKPVFDRTDIAVELLPDISDTISYVACPLRYNPVLQYVKHNINCEKVYSARSISSSYLPEWRPGTDYRQCYSAHRDMGGGVGIDLIHEWDYLTFLFGMPKRNFSIQDKISHLEIDSDDIAIYIAKMQNTTIELHLDYFGRESVRTLELFMPDDTIRCDLLNGRVDFLKSKESVVLDKERNYYQILEIEHFLDIVDQKIDNDSNILHAIDVLKLAKGEQL